jgi:hypothetical protein
MALFPRGIRAVSFNSYCCVETYNECITVFSTFILATSSSGDTGLVTTYSDKACTTFQSVLTISSTCSDDNVLIRCTSDPFDFDTASELTVET